METRARKFDYPGGYIFILPLDNYYFPMVFYPFYLSFPPVAPPQLSQSGVRKALSRNLQLYLRCSHYEAHRRCGWARSTRRSEDELKMLTQVLVRSAQPRTSW